MELEADVSIQDLVTNVTADGVISLCEAGRYREAQAALADLDPETSALAFGMVETALGSQDRAKDYLSKAFRENPCQQAAVQLACAYWRAGEPAEAETIIESLPDSFDVLLLKAIIVGEIDPRTALDLLEIAAGFPVSAGKQARLHNQRALLLRKIGKTDRALQEYDAAIFFFEAAGSDCLPFVLNNVAGVYLDYGRFDRAHGIIDQAIRLLRQDDSHLAKAIDQKAQVYLAENKPDQALDCSVRAIKIITRTDKKAWQTECLKTQAKVLIRKKEWIQALIVLRAIKEIGLYLDNGQIILDALVTTKEVTSELASESETEAIKAALSTSKSVRAAARKLKISHVALMKAMARKGIKSRQ